MIKKLNSLVFVFGILLGSVAWCSQNEQPKKPAPKKSVKNGPPKLLDYRNGARSLAPFLIDCSFTKPLTADEFEILGIIGSDGIVRAFDETKMFDEN